MEFFCYELNETVKAKRRPIVVITSNNEKELPDAFLRRCFFHYIRFPDRETMREIVKVHYPDLGEKLMADAMRLFYEIRDVRGVKKKPSTSELIDWIKLLTLGRMEAEELSGIQLNQDMPPFAGALLKNEQDHDLLNHLRNRYQR